MLITSGKLYQTPSLIAACSDKTNVVMLWDKRVFWYNVCCCILTPTVLLRTIASLTMDLIEWISQTVMIDDRWSMMGWTESQWYNAVVLFKLTYKVETWCTYNNSPWCDAMRMMYNGKYTEITYNGKSYGVG